MSQPKTTWEDLSRLGWPINNIFKAANAVRNGTMRNTNDLALNDRFADRWGWYSHNTTIGAPYILGRTPNSIVREETAWVYDNTQSSKPFTDNWSESWSNSSSATVTISTNSTIALSNQITIFNVASSGFDISISTDTSTSETKETRYELSHTWEIAVGPHEKVSLIRVVTTESEVVEYGQDFGVTEDSNLATDGNLFHGHYYIGMGINPTLGYPKGRMILQGSSKVTTYSFKLVVEGPNGRTSRRLPINLERDMRNADDNLPAPLKEKWEEIMGVGDDKLVVEMVFGSKEGPM